MPVPLIAFIVKITSSKIELAQLNVSLQSSWLER
jgi:hypothetical protein